MESCKTNLKIFKSDLGLTFQASSSNMILHVDADWGSDSTDRKPISGYCVFISNVGALWGSKKQNSVALSTTKAKYNNRNSNPN